MKPFNSGNYIKAKDIKNNEQVEFVDEGEWETTTFVKKDQAGNEVVDSDGNKVFNRQFVIGVNYNGEPAKLKVTKGSYGQIAEAYGDDTVNWIGKKASMMAIPAPNGKDKTILLYPVME